MRIYLVLERSDQIDKRFRSKSFSAALSASSHPKEPFDIGMNLCHGRGYSAWPKSRLTYPVSFDRVFSGSTF
jgi:hypothetical protein